MHAMGKKNVVGLVLPEKASNLISSSYAIKYSKELGIKHRKVDISPTVDGIFPYSKRDEKKRLSLADTKLPPCFQYTVIVTSGDKYYAIASDEKMLGAWIDRYLL